MIHSLEVSGRSLTYPGMYRHTVFTIVVYLEMYRDTIVTIEILICITILYRSWCLPVFLAFCVSAVARALPCVCLVTRTHVSLPMFHLNVHCRKCLMQKRVNWKQQVNLKVSSAHLDLSRGMKANEFADLTTSEFLSEYTGYKSNIMWSGRKHLGTHAYVDETLDQVKTWQLFSVK